MSSSAAVAIPGSSIQVPSNRRGRLHIGQRTYGICTGTGSLELSVILFSPENVRSNATSEIETPSEHDAISRIVAPSSCNDLTVHFSNVPVICFPWTIKPPAWRSASFLKESLLFSLVNIWPQAEASIVQAPFKSAACIGADCVTRSANVTKGLKILMKPSNVQCRKISLLDADDL